MTTPATSTEVSSAAIPSTLAATSYTPAATSYTPAATTSFSSSIMVSMPLSAAESSSGAAAVFASQPVGFSSPSASAGLWSSPDVTPLFQTLAPTFPWQIARTEPPASLFPASQTQGSNFFGPTFSGSPGIVRPPDSPIFGSPMASLVQSLTHISNVGQIVTIKLKAVEDYLTWRTQFESFIVSQGLLGMLDGSILVPPIYTVDFNNRQVPNTEYYHWLRVDQTIRSLPEFSTFAAAYLLRFFYNPSN
ncbi:unnamed protein product [Cuscuta epithymum]|uniref:Uncharacterized protein n=1 Tax=Cuscuta epithymum TaxID=186058 RepID=A0AAV0FBM1_9ASTE|nr:unnamed protein product [Cuscuta epithymum]